MRTFALVFAALSVSAPMLFPSACEADGIPTHIVAQTDSPVTVAHCDAAAGLGDSVNLTFVNHSDTTADGITFQIETRSDDGRLLKNYEFTRIGNFSKGVLIQPNRTLSASDPMFTIPHQAEPISSVLCGVAGVHFTDGSRWSTPASEWSTWNPLDDIGVPNR